MLLTLGDRKLAVCRELTKLHEEIFRGTVSEAIAHFTETRGEFTLVIEGKGMKARPQMTESVEKQLHQIYLAGATAKEAIAAVAGETGLSKKELYRAWLRLDKVWDREKGPCEHMERS
jgi:16S rRNA (cytidine1402-2'-O)-methyltransferase